MTKKYSDEEHKILSQCALTIGLQFLNMVPVIHEDKELMDLVITATECFKQFSKKMQER